MPVLLASGIVCVSTARTRIRSAKRAMFSGVSNATPAGAAPNVVSLGNREWQGRQRCTTTARTATNGGGDAAGAASPPPFVAVRAVVVQRCLPCHSRFPSDTTFGAAPAGVAFDTPENIARFAERIRVRAVETQTMPLANKTGMTPDERALLARWIAAGAPLR